MVVPLPKTVVDPSGMDALFDMAASDSVTRVYQGGLRQYTEQTLPLNPEQTRACFAPLNTALQVLAGAGTGKTMLITARMLTLMDELLKQGVINAESRILVMTFTKKAASEMRERIHGHLRQAGYQGPLPQENITTFNSFGQGFLKRHSLQAGLSEGVIVLDDVELLNVRHAISQRILKGNATQVQSTLERFSLFDKQDVPNSVNPEVLSPDAMMSLNLSSPMDVVLEEMWKIVDKAKSYGLTPVSFRSLAREQCLGYSQRIKTLPTHWQGMPATSVDELYNAWFAHLRPNASEGWLAEANALGDYASNKEAYKALLDTGLFKLHPAIEIKRVPKVEVTVPEEATGWHSFDSHTQFELHLIDVVATLFALYQERLKLDNALDYDDQINLTLHTLQQHPELAQRYQEWFHAIMVDEFQDTNGSQLALLNLLMRHPAKGTWASPNLTVVGDVKQSIYGFRFAQKENMHLIFQGLSPLKVALTENYRSRRGILHVANHVAALTAETFQEIDPPLEVQLPSDPASPEEVTAWYFGEKDEKDKIMHSKPWRQECALQVMATQVMNSIQEVGETALSNIAVLVSNHHEVNQVASVLNALNILTVQDVDAELFKQPLVKQAWALLRLLHHPQDAEALVRLWQPLLPPMRLFHAIQQAQVQPPEAGQARPALASVVLHILQQQTPQMPSATQKTLEWMVDQLVQKHEAGRYSPPQEHLQQWRPVLQTLMSGTQNTEETSALKAQGTLVLLAFEDFCQHLYEQLGRRYSLGVLLQELERASQNPRFKLPFREGEQLSRVNAVRLLTVHASKGLEFNHVHVLWFKAIRAERTTMSFDPQVSPRTGVGLVCHKTTEGNETLKHKLYSSVWHKPRAELELRRLYYVALTRAKQRLHVYVDAKLLPKLPWLELPSNDDAVAVHIESELPSVFNACYETARTLKPLQETRLTLPQDSLLSGSPKACPEVQQTIQAMLPGYRLPRFLSFSALNQLERCPAQYWYQHVQGLPQQQLASALTLPHHHPQALNENDKAALRGKALHRMIEAYYRFSRTTTESELATLVAQVLEQALGGVSSSEAIALHTEATAIYARFIKSPYTFSALERSGYEVVGSEYELNFTLPPEVTGMPAPYRFRGIIDVLLYNPKLDVYALLDFKTNHRLGAAQLTTYHEQLKFYRLGILSNNTDVSIPESQCQIVHLTPEGDIHRYPLPEASENRTQASPWLTQRLNELIEIHQRTTPPDLATHPVVSLPCRFCTYTSSCPVKASL